MSKDNKPSAVEGFKADSNYLRGEIAAELADGNAFFGKGSIQLLKHHGTYQQDNRDQRKAARADGRGKAYSMMVRTKIPGGRLTADQLLAELDLCDELGDTTLRVTTRQGLQLHGVVKGDLQHVIQRINQVQLSTLGACGDVNRNVMCCPAPYHNDPVHAELQALADRLADYFAPHTPAYHEIWLADGDGSEPQLVGGGCEEVEPIYGKLYMPRKFKMGIALPGDNCIDAYSQDLGLLAVCRDFEIAGYNVLVGGGFGVTPSAEKTFPAVAKRMAYVPADRVRDVAEAVVKVQRDFGNRSDRKVARLKYLIANWGIDKFKSKVEEYFGGPLDEPVAEEVWGYEDHLGWTDQGDGRWFYGLNVENGRIKDEGSFRLKSALREICSQLAPRIRLTAHQSILFTDLAEGQRAGLEQILRTHGVPLLDQISAARRWSMACPAMPTCGLAVTESERVLPGIIDQLERELAKLGLSDEVFTIRMTGCPNGCARPYNADVGLVGKTLGKYTILVGGRRLGDRLNFIYKDVVPAEEVVLSLVPLLIYFKQDRQEAETFGDFCHRKGKEDLEAWAAQRESRT
ncbi:MAG: NADPH-dependent assimilatory sulfite reductase hemoprotein subunit [Planctomycetales bacterium]|nr:NADPH-dependent assimilatory sulfite reductase hemoprotein subunit [Planctomycetales bacterium]NIM10071.1 NADPH-dependent assimilatory sulfite reductase hemoprotein subunit [Planctomycetales bacterium]NIN09512.1 NADPH-dependent assimilatory sulfite reductase hemoprotein subunit [Planctomycetales bacterium]NIN78623.1 NADPH-dependent assimilatory sulfite reductase hemoprotein subunit [Planctomycetales bacterium]NIO35817.1 NADPH-dependent assimilatory sulfite reductase hemoprotein subunit [Plan